MVKKNIGVTDRTTFFCGVRIFPGGSSDVLISRVFCAYIEQVKVVTG